MAKYKRFLPVLALCVLLCLLVACQQQDATPTTTGENTTGTTMIEYTIVLCSEGGVALPDVGIYVYTDSTQQELVWFAKTDAEGKITFTDLAADGYVAVLSNVPAGFTVEESYQLTGAYTQIIACSEMAEGSELEGVQLKLGDVMLDFMVTTPDGTEYILSDLLEQKQVVVLNYWYLQCQPCREEFPYLQEAYADYREQAEVLALNPVNADDEGIAALAQELGLQFPMAQCDPVWESVMQLSAYPTTVVIDRYGIISMIHTGSIPDADTFRRIFEYYTAEDYQQAVVESIDDLPELEDTVGSTPEEPLEIAGVSSFQVTVAPGELAYCNIYKVSSMYLSVNNANAYITCDGITHYPSGGRVGFMISAPDTFTPVSLAIGNSGSETQTYTIYLSFPQGSYGNPYTMELGEFTATVAPGNDQGVYYTYTATQDGVLTIQCLSAPAGVEYDYVLYNLSTSAYKNKEYDGVVDETTGIATLYINVYAGNRVQLTANTKPDETNSYPGGTFVFLASLGDAPPEIEQTEEDTVTYAVTVTDGDRQPVAGAYLNVTVEGEAKAFSTDQTGVAKITLPAGTYDAVLSIPVGYEGITTQLRLTEAKPYASVMLEKVEVITADYTVNVVDETGAPMADVLVTVGGSFGYTDANGIITLTLEQGTHTVSCVPPNGYAAEAASYTFEEGAFCLTIILKPSAEEDPDSPDDTMANYTVTVVDVFGNPQTGIVVQFLKDGTQAAIQTVDASGKAAVDLEKGSYTVSLAFTDANRYYDPASAVLSAEVTDLTITVADILSGDPIYLYVGNAYPVDVGGTYAQLSTGATNYFLFTPTQSGVYRFTTSDPEAVISYWGGNVNFIVDSTSGTDYANNAFTLNVRESTLGTSYILGVTGADDCVLIISRISDPILDENDAEWIIYEAQTEPKPFTLTMGTGEKLVYFDISGRTEDYQLVYNAADGYYHLGTQDGPVVLVNLGGSAPYLSIQSLLEASALRKYFYDENGVFTHKEEYSECMLGYLECVDEKYGVYPLTDDIIYIIQQHGGYAGWWNPESGSCLFTNVEDLNTQIAWMFLLCYVDG